MLRAAQFARIAERFLQQFEVAEDDRENVVEVVRDARRQLTDRFHFLRLAQLRLHAGAVRDVDRDAQYAELYAAWQAYRDFRRIEQAPAFAGGIGPLLVGRGAARG